jgi:hypothetical protein
MGRYLRPTAQNRLNKNAHALNLARSRYRYLEREGVAEAEYGRDMAEYIRCLEAERDIWVAALDAGGPSDHA